jgi:hypothetical protein
MKLFSTPGYLIANSRAEVKVAYTGFLALTAVGLATMVVLELGRIGFSPEGIATHFRGGDFGGEMRFARTFGELVELTHFHAFIMGTVYLVLAHLVVATTIPSWLRWGVIVGTLAALILDLVAVWLVRYSSAAFAGVLLLAWAAEWAGFGLMIGASLIELWRRRPPDDDEDGDPDVGSLPAA